MSFLSFISPLFVYFILAIFGLTLGSYLNSWMWRVHEGKWQWGGRSMCIHCSRILTWKENIPIISFIILGGKCKTCQEKIPKDYFLVELITAVLFVVVAVIDVNRGVSEWHVWRDIFFIALLVVVFVYDLKYYLVISGVAYGGAAIAFFVNFYFLHFTLYSLLLGLAVGGGFFAFQYIISKGRWIGGGDVRLGLMMGALLTWPNILVALFFSYVLGAAVSIPLLIFKKKGIKSEIPFGTFLAVGTLVAMLWGSQIMNWYVNLIKW